MSKKARNHESSVWTFQEAASFIPISPDGRMVLSKTGNAVSKAIRANNTTRYPSWPLRAIQKALL
ncbi:MAG: hypothetical protein WC377_05445 [Bacteroidales bacterium]|nr:hypothetical protein [Bacteroidales bacterium]MDD2824728.1 hypothetical protein [Bacteroidales bacterium]MDD3101221.1 hypothetical protein [Bacteroidales bacterium]MDD3639955.1 hypothetical protein [Bacteroidales bacterium]MDD3944675.1 hypothetical protein [Bacteroidales bacterium]